MQRECDEPLMILLSSFIFKRSRFNWHTIHSLNTVFPFNDLKLQNFLSFSWEIQLLVVSTDTRIIVQKCLLIFPSLQTVGSCQMMLCAPMLNVPCSGDTCKGLMKPVMLAMIWYILSFVLGIAQGSTWEILVALIKSKSKRSLVMSDWSW